LVFLEAGQAKIRKMKKDKDASLEWLGKENKQKMRGVATVWIIFPWFSLSPSEESLSASLLSLSSL